MKYSEIEAILKDVVSTTKTSENSWTNLAKVGIHLRKNGVKYVRLSKLLRNFTHIVEVKKDKSVHPPIWYIRLK